MPLASFTSMLEAEHCPDLFSDAAIPNSELLESYRSKISLHRAIAGYNYPMTRLSRISAQTEA
jgi:hypothetical protein